MRDVLPLAEKSELIQADQLGSPAAGVMVGVQTYDGVRRRFHLSPKDLPCATEMVSADAVAGFGPIFTVRVPATVTDPQSGDAATRDVASPEFPARNFGPA